MADLDVYMKVVERLEPEITAIDTPAALASIAISLRRLADHFEREEKRQAAAKAERKERNERLGQING